jgi:hypothetical protein
MGLRMTTILMFRLLLGSHLARIPAPSLQRITLWISFTGSGNVDICGVTVPGLLASSFGRAQWPGCRKCHRSSLAANGKPEGHRQRFAKIDVQLIENLEAPPFRVPADFATGEDVGSDPNIVPVRTFINCGFVHWKPSEQPVQPGHYHLSVCEPINCTNTSRSVCSEKKVLQSPSQ